MELGQHSVCRAFKFDLEIWNIVFVCLNLIFIACEIPLRLAYLTIFFVFFCFLPFLTLLNGWNLRPAMIERMMNVMKLLCYYVPLVVI